LQGLPPQARIQAQAAYRKFAADPEGSGLRFKKVNDEPLVYSARVSERLRVLGYRSGDTVSWFWIGYHDEYDRIIGNL
jgi:hypothetical protein